MLDLIYKDIVQGRRLILFYLAIGLVFGFVMLFGLENVGGILGTLMVFSSYGFAIRSTYDEDKNGAFLFLKSLPLSDAAIVSSKFLSTLAVTLLLGVSFQVFAVIGEGVVAPRLGLGSAMASRGGIGVLFRETAGNAAILFGVVMVMLSIYLTMFFCIGYAKASAYNRLVMLGIFAAVFIGISIAQRSSPEAIEWLRSLETSTWIPPAAAVAGLAVYAAGCAVSILWVRSRDWS